MSDKTTVENAKGDKEVVENPHLNPESLTITERIEALVTGYAHGLEHSAPST